VVAVVVEWLLGDGGGESLRRRAVQHAIRQEMDLHPVEREDFDGVKAAGQQTTTPNLAGVRRHLWRSE